MRTLKYEEVYMNDYETLAEVRVSVEHLIDAVYNCKRLHSAISYRPQVEFEASLAQLSLSELSVSLLGCTTIAHIRNKEYTRSTVHFLAKQTPFKCSFCGKMKHSARSSGIRFAD